MSPTQWQATIHYDDGLRLTPLHIDGLTQPSMEEAKSFVFEVLHEQCDVAEIKYIELLRNEKMLIFEVKTYTFDEGREYPDDPNDYRIRGPYTRKVEIRLV